MPPKKIPLRMCVACRESKPKFELARVVKNQSGEVSLDITGKMPGRGAYICRSVACLKKAQKSRALERALGPLPPQLYEQLAQQLEDASDE